MGKATLKELQKVVGGEIIGDENLALSGISGLDDAREGEITFIAKPAYLARAGATGASAIIVSHAIEAPGKALLINPNPYLAYAQIAAFFNPRPAQPQGIDRSAIIGKDTRVGSTASIHPLVVLGDRVTIADGVIIYPHTFVGDDCFIDEGTVIYSNVSIRERCRIGRRVIIHAGSVIGSDGFGFAPEGRRYCKIPQVGTVQIDDDVEIGANNTIDRGALGKTWIKRGAKTDNLVHIAHNVVVGEDTLLVAQVGVSGSTVIGNHVTIAGQVGVVGHVAIGDNTLVGAKTGISSDVPPNSIVSGTPHMPHREWLKASRCFPLLPGMRKTLRRLEERLAKLEEMLNKHT